MLLDFGSKYINSIVGGSIMALASTLHLFLQGKITGISGALFRSISFTDFSYNFSFLMGMLFMSAFIQYYYNPLSNFTSFFETPTKYVSDLSLPGFILAGFLVGFGAKMANGCTSGHGVCGIPRLSKRSFVAISLFMIFGIMIATIRQYFPFLKPSFNDYKVWEISSLSFFILILSCVGFLLNLLNSFKKEINDTARDMLLSFLIGALFSFGLIQSGMLKRHVVIEFLTLGPKWNIQLAFVLGSAVGINFFTFNFILKKVSKPRFKIKYDLPISTTVDNKLCLGATIFGLGWGLSGICPGPAVLTCYLYCPQISAFFISLCTGMYIEYYFDNQISRTINRNKIIKKIS